MLRLLLLLLPLLAAILVGSGEVVAPLGVETAATADDDCGCCPEATADDCCTWDFGACHSHSLVAVMEPPAPLSVGRRLLADAEDRTLSRHLLLPRDNGPPPTPPPIG